jgi:hypothetical protein
MTDPRRPCRYATTTRRIMPAAWCRRCGSGTPNRQDCPAASRSPELIRIDVKKHGRIKRPGHRIHGDRTTRAPGLHVWVDDCTRLAYAVVIEQGGQGANAAAPAVCQTMPAYLRFDSDLCGGGAKAN